MVFGRLGWPSGSDLYTVKTKGGMILPDSHPLANYGLGSLLQNWELEVIKKEDGKLSFSLATCFVRCFDGLTFF